MKLVCGSGGAVGDVVALRTGGTVIVHRVVARSATGGWIVTRGDARLLPDVPASGDAIIGLVSGRRGPRGFEDVPGTEASLAQRAALAPLVSLLRVSPRAGTAVIATLIAFRRRLFAGVGALRGALPSLGGGAVRRLRSRRGEAGAARHEQERMEELEQERLRHLHLRAAVLLRPA